MGAGKHMNDKLAPALLKLQSESDQVRIIAIVRENPIKGGIKDINVPVYKSIQDIPVDSFNTIIACGPPSLHLMAIQYAVLHQKKCFVEKPHLICVEDVPLTDQLPKGSMIGYNFNFMPFLNEMELTNISVGTKGLYKDWGSLFPSQIEDFMYAIHSVLVHPISMFINRYGRPDDVDVVGDHIDMTLMLKYGDQNKTIDYTSLAREFFMICRGDNIYECKSYKAQTYYDMLKYFLSNDVIEVNNFQLGKEVINVIKKCETLLMGRTNFKHN
jgi:hypothetical protein